MQSPETQIWLWRASIALELGLLARLLLSVRRLQWLAAVPAAMLAQDFALLLVRQHSESYFYTWSASLVVVLLTQVAASLEAFRDLLSDYPGIGKVGTWVVSGSLAVAFAITSVLATNHADAFDRGPARLLLVIMFAVAQVWTSILAIFLTCASTILFWFKVPHRPNDEARIVILAAFLSLNAVAYMALNVWPAYHAAENLAFQTGVCLCLAAALLFLTRKGEVRAEAPAAPFIDAAKFQRWNQDAMELFRSVKPH